MWNGSYTENVDIATSHLTLRGEGADLATVTAASSSDHVFDVTADYVNISGFTATGATVSGEAGVRLGSRQHCNISENNCSGNHLGIWLSASSSNNMLTGNNCSDNSKFGIHLPSSSNNMLAGNTANSNNDYGICLDNADNNNITCNWVHNNTDAGFYLKSESTGNTIERNNIIANGNYNDASGGWEWQFRNDQPDDVDTAGNWWGTSNETRINASINDWTYNTNRGNVTTNPKLDGTVPCAPIPELPTAMLLAVGLLMLVGCARIGRKM